VRLVMPQLNLGGLVLEIYPVLAAAYFLMFMLYFLLGLLLTFDDAKGAAMVAALVCAGVVLGSVFAVFLPVSWYGIGMFIGPFAGWTMAFYRMRAIEKNIHIRTFC